MRWPTHAGTGALFGLAADALAGLSGHPLPPLQSIALPLVSTYASAWPDVDHHSAKIRHAVPPLRWLYVAAGFFVRLIWGEAVRAHWMGHRRITHSAVFAAGSGAASAAVMAWVLPPWWAVLVGAGVTLGCVAHCAGDACTPGRVPFLAPHSWERRKLVTLCSTGSTGEARFAAVQAVAVFAMVFVAIWSGGRNDDSTAGQVHQAAAVAPMPQLGAGSWSLQRVPVRWNLSPSFWCSSCSRPATFARSAGTR